MNPPDPTSAHATSTWRVICLCADWCGTCREWRPALAAVARGHPEVPFAWVDIEDRADAVGDLDIETFPTLLIACGDRVRFFGPVLPHAGNIERLLATLRQDEQAGSSSPEAQALLLRLRDCELELV